jgi:putative hydrolase of the HAD superfamily
MTTRPRRPRARRPQRALLIDAMGTLVALLPPAPRLRRELHDRFGIDVGLREAGAALAAEIAFYRAHMGQGRDAATLGELRLGCARALAAALPPSAALAALSTEELRDVLLASLRFEAFADAPAALMRARAAGVRVVVVSNWDVSVLEVLETTGLAPLLDGAVCSAVVGVPKPQPVIFEQALAIAGVGPQDAVHVGDSLTEDVAGALGAGIEPVLIDRTGSGARVPGLRTIAGLDELDWPPPPARGGRREP